MRYTEDELPFAAVVVEKAGGEAMEEEDSGGDEKETSLTTPESKAEAATLWMASEELMYPWRTVSEWWPDATFIYGTVRPFSAIVVIACLRSHCPVYLLASVSDLPN